VPTTLLVIPTYNHSGTLRDVAGRALATGLPVLVVDDGSTDEGLAVLDGLPVQRHRLPVNQGKGAALLAAARLAREGGFEAMLTLDADGQHDPADGPVLLDAVRGIWPGVVVGVRAMEGPTVPRSSLFGRSFSNFWVRLECGRNLPDTQSGFRLYPVAFLLGTPFLTRRYTFEVEVLVRAAWAGLPILSVPVAVHYPPGEARVTHFRAFRDNARLTCLHTWLVCRALVGWRRGGSSWKEGLTAARAALVSPAAFLKNLCREHGSALELAAAVWVGIAVGSLPIIPFGLAAIVFVAQRFHLNKLAAAGASNVCIAPFVPFLCIQAGHLMRSGRLWTDFNRSTLVGEVHLRLWEWLLGSLLVGPLLGLAGACATYVLVRSLRGASSSGAA
jgi:uncharacterized protein (DUF2062 family)